MAILCRDRLKNEIITIGHYRQPSSKTKCKQELAFFAKNLLQMYPYGTFIVAGDFNQSQNEIQMELQAYGLQLAKSQSQLISRYGSNEGNLIDHIASNATIDSLGQSNAINVSDHRLVYTKIFAMHRPMHPHKHTVYKVKGNLSNEEVTKVINSRDWPQKPFYRAALGFDLADQIKVEGDGLRKFAKLLETLDDHELCYQELNKDLHQLQSLLREMGQTQFQEERDELTCRIDQHKAKLSSLLQICFNALISLNNNFSRGLINRARKLVSRQFFENLKNYAKLHHRGALVKGFKSNVNGDEIVHSITIPQYLSELYYTAHKIENSTEINGIEGMVPHQLQFEEEDLRRAWAKLSFNKAVGIDQLPDMYLKNPIIWNGVKDKILSEFNRWAQGGRKPDYVKRARYIPLSKDISKRPFPEVGNVRLIAILPAISKLYETCLLLKLNQEIEEKKLVSQSQRNFQSGKSCEDNLMEVIHWISILKHDQKFQGLTSIQKSQRDRDHTYCLQT